MFPFHQAIEGEDERHSRLLSVAILAMPLLIGGAQPAGAQRSTWS
jgi:hypothetical protein